MFEFIPPEHHDRVIDFANRGTIGAQSFIGATVVMSSLEADHLATKPEQDPLENLESRIAATLEKKTNPDEVGEVNDNAMHILAESMMREGDNGGDTSVLGELLNQLEAEQVAKDIIRYFASNESMRNMSQLDIYRLLMTMRDAIINDKTPVLPGFINHTLQDAASETTYQDYIPDNDVAGMLALAGVPVNLDEIETMSKNDRSYYGGGQVTDNLSVTVYPFSSVAIDIPDLLNLFPNDKKAEIERELEGVAMGREAKLAFLIGDVLLDVELSSEERVYCFGRKILSATAEHIAGYLADS